MLDWLEGAFVALWLQAGLGAGAHSPRELRRQDAHRRTEEREILFAAQPVHHPQQEAAENVPDRSGPDIDRLSDVAGATFQARRVRMARGVGGTLFKNICSNNFGNVLNNYTVVTAFDCPCEGGKGYWHMTPRSQSSRKCGTVRRDGTAAIDTSKSCVRVCVYSAVLLVCARGGADS